MAIHRRISLALRFLGFTLGGIATTIAALSLYIWLSFDVRHAQDELVRYMSERYQRKLTLDQDIKLSLWPWPALEIDQLSLSEPKSDSPTLTLQHIHAKLALTALLRQQAQIKQIDIDGANLHLIRNKDGNWNVADLLTTDAQKPTPEIFQPGQLVVENLSISAQDLDSEHLYTLKEARLVSGFFLPETKDSIRLQGECAADWPAMDGTLDISADYVRGQPGNGQLNNISLRFNGRLDDIADSRSTITADMLSWTNPDWQLDNVQAEVQGNGEQSYLSLSAKLPQLKSSLNGLLAEKASAQFNTQIQGNTHSMQFNLQNLTSAKDQLKTENIQFAWNISSKKTQLETTLASPANFDDKTGTVELASIKGQSVYDKEKPPVQLEGNAKWNLRQNTKKKNTYAGQISLTAQLEDAPLKLDAQLQKLDPVVAQLNVSSPRLDLTPLFGKQNKITELMPNLSDMLRNTELTKDSSINADEMILPSFTLQDVRMPLLLKDGRLTSISHNAKAYGGLINGNISYNANDHNLNWQASFSSVNLADAPKPVNDLLTLTGKASGTLEIIGNGDSLESLQKNLQGNLQYSIASAELAGINLEKTLHEFHAPSMAKKTATRILGNDEKTALNDANVVLEIQHGQIMSEGLNSNSAWGHIALVLQATPDGTRSLLALTVPKTLPKDASREMNDLREKALYLHIKKDQDKRLAELAAP